MNNNFAVFGNPIKHSLSPQIHQLFAAQHKVEISYRKILSEKDRFTDDIADFFAQGGHGCNVTVPFKEQAFELCTELSESANRAQAANTLYKDADNRICGHNTDGAGLLRDLTDNLKLSLHGSRIIILGAGGATRGILQPLINQSPESIIIINRTHSKAESLAQEFGDLFSVQAVSADNITGLPTASLIINATSASLDAKLPVSDSSLISHNTVSYDLAYAQEPTRFLQWTKSCGSQRNHDGRGMLVEQAALAFETWTRLPVHTQSIIENFKELET